MKTSPLLAALCISICGCSTATKDTASIQQIEQRLERAEFEICRLKAFSLYEMPSEKVAAPTAAKGIVLCAQRGNKFAREWIRTNITNREVALSVAYEYAISPMSSTDELQFALSQVEDMLADDSKAILSDHGIAVIYARNNKFDDAIKYQEKYISTMKANYETWEKYSHSVTRKTDDQKRLELYRQHKPYIEERW